MWTAALTLAGCPEERPRDYFEPPRPMSQRAADAGVPEPRPAADDGDDADPTEPDAATPDEAGQPDQAAGASTGSSEPSAPDRLPSFAGLFERLSPSVVNIYTQEVIEQRLVDPWTGRMAPPRIGTSLGSGLVLDGEGYIVTNAHVVENAAEIRVRFRDDSEMPARLIGIDPVRDLALLKVDADLDVEPVAAGDVDDLRVGDWVLAIGNPFGLSHTLTKGIVSAKGRAEIVSRDQGYMDLIQTDAPINRGSSGGPLFDLDGEVVGINTAVNAEGQGIAFAIPWNVVADALPRLKQGGQVSRSWLGVYVRPRGPDLGEGLLVEAVVEDSPAIRAGLRPGDVILALDGRPVEGPTEFRLQVAAGVAGRAMPVVIRRGRERRELDVTLEEARGP